MAEAGGGTSRAKEGTASARGGTTIGSGRVTVWIHAWDGRLDPAIIGGGTASEWMVAGLGARWWALGGGGMEEDDRWVAVFTPRVGGQVYLRVDAAAMQSKFFTPLKVR